MAEQILPAELPAAASVVPGAAIVGQNSATVEKFTPLQIVDAARPLASQAEAEAGINNSKIMTALRTDQAIDALVFAPLALASGSGLVQTIAAGTGAVARTMQSKLRDVVNARDFGAIGNGTADDTASLQAMLNSLSFGGQAVLGRGTYKYSALTIPNGVTIIGDNDYASTLICSSAVGKITAGVSSGLSNLKVTASVARTPDYELVYLGSNGGFARNVVFANYSLAVRVGTLPGTIVVKPVIEGCNFFSPVVGAGTGAIALDYYSNAIVANCTGSGASFPGQQPDFGVRLRNGDTAYLTNNNFTLHGKALLIDTPPGYNAFATNVVNCTFDSSGLISLGNHASSAEIIPGGGVYDTLFTNCWFGLSSNASGCFVTPQGAGVVDGLSFCGCEFVANGDDGLLVDGLNALNWSVTGGWSAGNTNVGLRSAGATKRFTITGHRSGNVANRGVNNVGISVDNATAADYYVIASNNLVGNTIAGLFDGGTGIHKQITGNLV